MGEAHRIHCYEYVNRPYEEVSEALVLGAVGIFQRATSSAAVRATSLVSKLKVTIAGLEVGKNVVVRVVRVDRHAKIPQTTTDATQLELEWHAETERALFPSMHATLTAYPLSPNETQLDLDGQYDPPGGILGEVADRLVGHRLAEASVHKFLQDVAGRLAAEQ
jgi:hypothetical protein